MYFSLVSWTTRDCVPVQPRLQDPADAFGRMKLVPPLSDVYRLDPAQAEQLVTPALLIYPALVDQNIQATLKLAGGDANRWRPHLKTAKIPAVIRMLVAAGVHNVKCSTTLELLVACQEGASDVLLALAVTGANARRVMQIAESYRGKTRVSA